MPHAVTSRSFNHIRMVDWAHLKSELVWVYEGNVVPPYDNSRDHNPEQSALLLLQGEMLVQNEAGAVTARAGQWVFPRQGPRLQKFNAARVLSIHFNLYWPSGLPLFEWDTAMVLDSVDVPRLEQRSRQLLRTVDRHLPGVGGNLPWTRGALKTHLLFQRAFDTWLSVYVDALEQVGVTPSRLGPIDGRILQAVNMLDHWPFHETFHERKIASEIGLSPSQLDRLFIRQFNLTPRQYFEEKKVEQAKSLLRSAPLSIKQITYEIGFTSLPSFSRWFRQKTGVSPKAFQKKFVA